MRGAAASKGRGSEESAGGGREKSARGAGEEGAREAGVACAGRRASMKGGGVDRDHLPGTEGA